MAECRECGEDMFKIETSGTVEVWTCLDDDCPSRTEAIPPELEHFVYEVEDDAPETYPDVLVPEIPPESPPAPPETDPEEE